MQHSHHARNVKILGIGALIFGVLAMLVPGLAGYSIAILLGLLMLAAGLARIYWAFRANTVGKGMVMLAVGSLTFIAGLAVVIHPVFASGLLTIILTVYFIADGLAEIAAGLVFKPVAGWQWLLVGGIISLLLGILIISQFPFSGAWAVGILLGIKLLFIGLIMINMPQRSLPAR